MSHFSLVWSRLESTHGCMYLARKIHRPHGIYKSTVSPSNWMNGNGTAEVFSVVRYTSTREPAGKHRHTSDFSIPYGLPRWWRPNGTRHFECNISTSFVVALLQALALTALMRSLSESVTGLLQTSPVWDINLPGLLWCSPQKRPFGNSRRVLFRSTYDVFLSCTMLYVVRGSAPPVQWTLVSQLVLSAGLRPMLLV